jgi:uncharacterized protein YndB with AHSA1/START domain
VSVTDTTAPDQGEAITFEFDLRHPPEKVWRALTDPSLLAEWLLPMVGPRLAAGSVFTLQAPPQPGWDGVVNCRVLDIELHRRLSYSWVVGEIDTVVTFSLEPTAAGTRLSLLQSGFKPEQKRNFGGARYGWRLMGGRLAELLPKID